MTANVHWLTHPRRSKLTYLHFETVSDSLVYLFGVVSGSGIVNGVFDKDYARDVYQQAKRDGYVVGIPTLVCRCVVCSHYRVALSDGSDGNGGFECGWCNNAQASTKRTVPDGDGP